MLVLLFAFLAGSPGVMTPVSDPAPLWDDDVLIWDMTENSTWTGPGLTYCTGIFDLEGKQYAAAIIDSTGSQGNVVKLFSSDDGGDVWLYENWITGGSFTMTDPEMVLSPESPASYLYFFYTASSPAMVIPIGLRFSLPDFIVEAGLIPDWPASDTLLSVEAVCHPETGELWVFGDDNNHNINLSRSTDNGDSWTTAELVATDAVLPAAAPGPAGWVYLTYRRVSDNKIMSIAFGETSYYETEVADGGDTSAPIIASEQTGTGDISSIIYHDADFNIRMALSDDNGANWSVSSAIAKGYYPFIDVYRQTSRCALAFIDFNTEEIFYASADNLPDLASQVSYVVSDQPVALSGPPVVRYGTRSSEVGLFYMGPGVGGPAPQDLWYDNSRHTQSNPETGYIENGLTAVPNPFADYFAIEFGLDEPGECTLDIYTMDGRLIESVYRGFTTGESLSTGEGLPAGIYNVVLRAGGSITSRRIVKL